MSVVDKLKSVKKRIEETADGKREIDVGSEPLDKEPAKKKEKDGAVVKADSNPSQYKTPEKFTKEEMIAAIRQDIIAELDAINLYEAHKAATDNQELKDMLEHIIDEEKEHASELNSFLKKLGADEIKDEEPAEKSDKKKDEEEQNYPYPGKREYEINERRDVQPVTKTAKEIWEGSLKKQLDNASAILDIKEEAGMDDNDEADTVPVEPNPGELTPEDVEQHFEDEGQVEDVQEDEGQDGEPEEPEEGENEQVEEAEEAVEEAREAGASDEEIFGLLQQAGLNDVEIAHVMHGHHEPIPDPVDQAKIDAHNAKAQSGQIDAEMARELKGKEADIDNNHKQRTNDLEHEYDKKIKELELETVKDKITESELDREHKKRMLDLEYESAKKIKDMEFDMKRKELELRLENRKQAAKDKDVRTTKNVSKSFLTFDDLEKVNLWAYNKETGNFNHPEHGSVAIRPHAEKGFQVVHNGKIIGSHGNKDDAVSNAKDYMKNIKYMKVKSGGSDGK